MGRGGGLGGGGGGGKGGKKKRSWDDEGGIISRILDLVLPDFDEWGIEKKTWASVSFITRFLLIDLAFFPPVLVALQSWPALSTAARYQRRREAMKFSELADEYREVTFVELADEYREQTCGNWTRMLGALASSMSQIVATWWHVAACVARAYRCMYTSCVW